LHNGGGGSGDGVGEEEEGFLGAAKGWLTWGGGKLVEAEKEVWRRINDVHEK
jgi:hypothetical protein